MEIKIPHLWPIAVLLVLIPLSTHAAPPQVQTPSPVIYLADNLDEKDDLGWCIDTLGRGFAEKLQAHSCKPQGGDVQFSHDADTGWIASVPFEGKCMSLSAADDPNVPFGLLDCLDGEPSQRFAYDPDTGHIHPASDLNLCVAVGATSRSAGPFMSRDLILAPCAGTDAALTVWVVR